MNLYASSNTIGSDYLTDPKMAGRGSLSAEIVFITVW